MLHFGDPSTCLTSTSQLALFCGGADVEARREVPQDGEAQVAYEIEMERQIMVNSSNEEKMALDYASQGQNKCKQEYGDSMQAQRDVGATSVTESPPTVWFDDRVFCFSVASKSGGFFVYGLKSFEFDMFKINFHLWGRGGPHFSYEIEKWDKEENRSWTLVQNKKDKRQPYVDALWRIDLANEIMKRASLSRANFIQIHRQQQKNFFDCLVFSRISAFDRLQRQQPPTKQRTGR